MTSRPDTDPQGPLWCVPGLGPVRSGDDAGAAALFAVAVSALTARALRPTPAQAAANPRARSATLRVAERTGS